MWLPAVSSPCWWSFAAATLAHCSRLCLLARAVCCVPRWCAAVLRCAALLCVVQMEADPKCNDVSHLTLSYTFFPVEDDEDDTRTEEEKDAAGGLKLHGSADFPLPGATATDTNEPK